MGKNQGTWLSAFSSGLNCFVNMTHVPSSVNLPCKIKKATTFSESGDLVVLVVLVLVVLLMVPVEGADGGAGAGGAGANGGDGVGGAGAGCNACINSGSSDGGFSGKPSPGVELGRLFLPTRPAQGLF